MINLKSSLIVFAAIVSVASGQVRTSAKSSDDTAGGYHLSKDRGPVRHVDLSPLTQPVSSEILAGPTNGLDSAYIIYSRRAANVPKKGLFTLPVDHTYLVLSGKLNVQLGTDEFVMEPETLVLIPAGVPHQVWNAGSAPEADLEVVTPNPSRDLASMKTPATPRKVENAAQYIRVAPPLNTLQAGNRGGSGLNERVLAARASGSENVLERLDATVVGGGRAETHIHPFDQVYFIRTGVMTVQYGLKTFELTPNSLVIIPAGTVHSNVNKGPDQESHVTLLLPENPKGVPAGSDVDIKPATVPTNPRPR